MRELRSRTLAASLAVLGVTLAVSILASPAAALPQFTASLSGANEIPDPMDGASGEAQISIAGPTTICYRIEFFNFTGTASGAHIHLGAAGTIGPVLIALNPPPTAPSGVSSGCISANASDIAQIVSNPSGFYVNIHSNMFPAGEVRGQLQAATAALNPTGLTFGSAGGPVPQGTLSAPQGVTVTNNGAAPLVISGFVFGGANPDDFTLGADTCHAPVIPSASCTVQVRFAPQAQGTRSATLTVSSSAPTNAPISLQGTAGPLPQGPPGPRGAPGQIKLVTCKSVTVKSHGHKVKRRRCKTKVIKGTLTFTVAHDAQASLVRHGVLYATGTAGRRGLVLHARRTVRAGRYTLQLRYRRAQRQITASAQIAID